MKTLAYLADVTTYIRNNLNWAGCGKLASDSVALDEEIFQFRLVTIILPCLHNNTLSYSTFFL